MRKPSRSMPSLQHRPLGWAGTIVSSIFVIGFLALLIYQPWLLTLISVVAVVTINGTIQRNHRLSRLATEREGESICTFARSFDYRAVDTWILRAVFEELQPWCRFGRQVLPLRATDDLEHTLGIDPEDLEDLIFDVAQRSRRSVESREQNPLVGKIKTVSNLVSFLNNQPLMATA